MLGAKLASTGFLLYALFACLFYPLHRALCEVDRRMLRKGVLRPILVAGRSYIGRRVDQYRSQHEPI